MPSPNHHIILRQVFELEFPAGVDGFALQQEIGGIVREKLLPQIEALFDHFARADELIRIDKLELDIGRIPPAELEDVLMRSVLKQLEEQLEMAVINRPVDVERLPVAESHFDQWLFFLENGYRPHQMANVPEAALHTAVLEMLASERTAVERFRRLTQQHPVALIRLIRQHPESFLVHVLETLTARSQRNLPDFLREMLQWRDVARAIPKGAETWEVPASKPWGQALSQQTFWQQTFGLALQQPASNWTAENLFAVFLQYVAASAGSNQEPLLFFWRDVTQFKKTSYPLLKATLDRYPELLNAVENRAASGKRHPGESQNIGGERMEIRDTEHGAEKPADTDLPPLPPIGVSPTNTRQVDMPSSGEDQTQRQSPEENPTQMPRPDAQPVPPEGVSKYPPLGIPTKESTLPQIAQATASDESKEILPLTGGQQQPDKSEERLPPTGRQQQPGELREVLPPTGRQQQPGEPGEIRPPAGPQQRHGEPGGILPPAGRQQRPSEPREGRENTPTDPPPKPVQPTAEFTRPIRTGDFWYVANAGVVLLHPFLSPYFKKVGVMDKGNFLDEAARHKAVHLLHFLATGQTQAPEYELVLPRFLCGIPFDVPLERFVDITAEEQAEGEQLLTAAINHWNKLGNTSPGGLREGFLQRDGKLEKREAGWCLGVEQKTIDILLDFLPWNLSIIKLPWMPELLRVEWA